MLMSGSRLPLLSSSAIRVLFSPPSLPPPPPSSIRRRSLLSPLLYFPSRRRCGFSSTSIATLQTQTQTQTQTLSLSQEEGDEEEGEGEEGAEEDEAAPPPSDPVRAAAQALDIRVGRVVRAWRHPEAELLYSEDANVGEAEPRTICSGLVNYIPFDLIQTNYKAALATETLLTGEEAMITAAAAEAVALARAAVEVAKDAAQMIGNDPFARLEKSSDNVSPDDILRLEGLRLAEMESVHTIRYSGATESVSQDEHYQLKDTELPSVMFDDVELRKLGNAPSIAVRSGRQTERRARRARAAEKAASTVISAKSGSSGKKKRSTFQEIDYTDPLRYLRATTAASKLLTATEELELSEAIQDLLKLERLQEELAERNGGQPTFAQWAAAAGVDQRTLRKRLNYGTFCKDKMIKSNIRLVISIAKNYQGAGMNLQDLVQEGCRGLVKGAEKFDASKGFKFSTYAHWWIKQAVRKSLSEQSRTIRLPFHMVEATYRVREAKKQLYSENGRRPDYEEVAKAAGLSMKRLAAVMLTPKAPRSLDQKIGINQSLKPSEVIADPDAETAEDILIKQFRKQDLNKVLDTLNPREKQVVRWRFGLEDGRMKTLQEIGELMGVSRERIRQIESCAFRKLKSKKRTKNLRQYLI